MQRGGPQVVAQRQLAERLRREQLLHGPHRLHRGADVPAATRERQLGLQQLQVEAPPALGGHGVGQPPSGGDVRGAVVERTLEEPALGEDERELPIDVGRAGREGGEQREKGRGAAVEDEADGPVGKQACGVGPVARGLRMADRLDGRAVLLVPARRLPV